MDDIDVEFVGVFFPGRPFDLTFVLTREDGNWFIAAAQNTEINRTVN